MQENGQQISGHMLHRCG